MSASLTMPTNPRIRPEAQGRPAWISAFAGMMLILLTVSFASVASAGNADISVAAHPAPRCLSAL